MVNKKLIAVFPNDVEKLRQEVRHKIIRDHPDLEGINMTDAFLFKQVVEYALGGIL